MYDGMKLLQIQNLREGGLSVKRTAEAAGVSLATVVRVSAEESIEDPKGFDEEAKARMGRPSKLEPHREKILGWLACEPELAAIAVIERLREEGYEGGKIAVYDFVRKHRVPKTQKGIVRFEAVLLMAIEKGTFVAT